jgi:superfamily I DNA and/or RNA helicase
MATVLVYVYTYVYAFLQMTEPLSLLPICRFSSERAILVGDPLQLAPTLACNSQDPKTSLERTLFERLAELNLPPILLRTQYRCHPRIAEVANSAFYDRALQHGCNPADVRAIKPEISPLVFVNVTQGAEEIQRGGSIVNSEEIISIVHVVRSLLRQGIPPVEIGVVTFCECFWFRYQTDWRLTNMLLLQGRQEPSPAN